MKQSFIILLFSSILFTGLNFAYGDHRIAVVSTEKVRKAVSKSESGEITDIKEKKGVYEISVTKADGSVKSIYIDAATGKIIKKMPVGLEEAMSAALKKVPGKVVNVKFKKGVYEIYVKTDEDILKEVYVSAQTGQIIKIKIKE